MNTWSWASVQTPLTDPVTHLFGSGLGHEGSTSYLGGLPCAAKGYVQRIINAVANAAASAATMRQVILALSFILLIPLTVSTSRHFRVKASLCTCGVQRLCRHGEARPSNICPLREQESQSWHESRLRHVQSARNGRRHSAEIHRQLQFRERRCVEI